MIGVARTKTNGSSKDSSAHLGFEAKLWLAADKLCNNIDAAEYKHVVLGLDLLHTRGRVMTQRELAADVGRAGGPRGLWVLAPGNDQHALPTLDGAPIPITNAAQHTRLTCAWLRNEHRAAEKTS